ncbi:hypothetical protein ABT084_11745 [Streptomyces sp. NPDC002138]|uniref:protein kinase domain-containing protein n=1 Tax=Streptomyces sp. NPDC002138 TaxID=3154410 RepID=UPI003322EB4C
MLTDFGIASVIGATQPLTATGMVVGTVGYMTPERLSESGSRPKADLWSLGATLYFTAEGRSAYNADDVVAMIAAVASRDPQPMLRAGTLAPAIAGLLVRDVDTRWDTAAARTYLHAVVAGGSGLETTALLPPAPQTPTKPAPGLPWNQDVPPATPRTEDLPGRPPRARGLTWLVAFTAAAARATLHRGMHQRHPPPQRLVADDAPVTYQMVRAHVATLRGAPAGPPLWPPTVRQVTGWLTRHPTTLTEEDRAGLKEVLARCPELDKAAGHVRDFGEILTDRLGAMLPTWIDAVPPVGSGP